MLKNRCAHYYIGIILTLLTILLGELLWLLDPIRLDRGMYFIDALERAKWIVLIIPFIWIASAAVGLRDALFRRRNESQTVIIYMEILITSAIIMSSVTAVVMTTGQVNWFQLGLAISISFLFVCIDLFISSWKRGSKAFRLNMLTIGLCIFLLILMLCPTTYRVTYPGLTINMNQYAAVESGYPKGEIMGVLIFERTAFPIDWLISIWNSQYSFEKILPTDPSIGEQLQVVRASKLRANDIASAVAFQKAGIGQGATYHGIEVLNVLKDSPSKGKLKPGDILIEINGSQVESIKVLTFVMETVQPGVTLDVTVIREEQLHHLSIETGSHPEHSNRAILGIQIRDVIELDLPLDVHYKPYFIHEGGPSHGAMLVLSLMNQLSDEDLIGEYTVAGTGTIRLDGSIGPIGGIQQKAFTVERAGADVFFVPSSQIEDARRGANDLHIVPVDSIDNVIQWLHKSVLK